MIFRLASIVLSILRREQRSVLLRAQGRAVPPPDPGTGAAGKPGPSIALADRAITTERLDPKTKSTKI